MYYLLKGTPQGVHAVARSLRSDGVYLRSYPDGRVYAKLGRKHSRLVSKPDPDHGVVFKRVTKEEVGAPLKVASSPIAYNCNRCGQQQPSVTSLANHIREVHQTNERPSPVVQAPIPVSAVTSSTLFQGSPASLSREVVGRLATELRTQGWKWRAIGEKLGYPYTTIISWIQRYVPGGMPTPPPNSRQLQKGERKPPRITYSPTPSTGTPEPQRQPRLLELTHKLQGLCREMDSCAEEIANEIRRLQQAFFLGEETNG